MSDESIQLLTQQLSDPDWLVRGTAIRKLAPICDRALCALPRLFELTFDENPPIRSYSIAVITRMKTVAVPFLLSQTKSDIAVHRARALDLLVESCGQAATTVRLNEQVLQRRPLPLPDWGSYWDEVRAAFLASLSDNDLAVRFAAASALEEFDITVIDTIPIFTEVLNKGTMHEINWAALHLGRIGSSAKSAVPVLIQVGKSSDQYVSLAAKNAVKRIRGELV